MICVVLVSRCFTVSYCFVVFCSQSVPRIVPELESIHGIIVPPFSFGGRDLAPSRPCGSWVTGCGGLHMEVMLPLHRKIVTRLQVSTVLSPQSAEHQMSPE